MSKVTKTWLTLPISIAGAGLTLVYAPAGVAVAFVGTMITVFSALALNVLATRAPAMLAGLANGYAVYLATGSAELASVPAVLLATTLPSQVILKSNRTLHDYMPAIGLAVGAGLVAAAWPVGLWVLALAPNGLLSLMLAVMTLKGRAYATAQLGKVKAKEGSELPDFELPGRDGQAPFKLSDHRGNFVLLCFVRGDWCPVCHVMLRIINREADSLAKHGVELVLITPSSGHTDSEYAQQLGIKGGMHLDEDSKLAKSLGLLEESQREGKDVPLPVTILVDGDGVVRNLSRPDDVTAFSNESKIMGILAQAAPA
jgi:peroxiredoxin